MGRKSAGSRNGFFFFMCELKRTMNLKTMAEASAAADPLWKALSPDERQLYFAMASQGKAKNRQTKLTAAHENLELLMKEEELNKQLELEMKEEIENLVHQHYLDDTLGELEFCVAHMNSFGYIEKIQKHFPAEVAIARFSLNEGVDLKSVFHRIVNPGKVPLGYAYSAKTTSDSSHQIPPPTDDSEINFDEVFAGICSYLGPPTKGVFPPLFVRDNELTLVVAVLNQLCHMFGMDKAAFRVYSLQHLLYVLMNSQDTVDLKWPTISQSIVALERDVYDYIQGIACSFHSETDVTVHCCQSTVIRSIFLICDYVCQHLRIKMIPGRHIPKRSSAVSDYVDVNKKKKKQSKNMRSSPRGSSESSSDSSETRSPGSPGRRDEPYKMGKIEKLLLALLSSRVIFCILLFALTQLRVDSWLVNNSMRIMGYIDWLTFFVSGIEGTILTYGYVFAGMG